jgi:Sec-independent protein translocase protein TatA
MKTLLITLVLICAVAVGAAFYLGWLDLSTGTSGDRRSEVTLTIDKEKVKDDLSAVKEKASEAGKSIGQTAKEAKDELKDVANDLKDKKEDILLGKTLDGQLTAVDMAKKEVTVKSNDGKDTVTVKVDGQTKIRVGDKDGTLADVKAGDTVTLVHMPKDGIDTALSLAVKPVKS